ncbi:hypothetical protein KRMM14A1259_26940 [Krasilnikovia sp. MM14-A1259]
MATIAVGVVTSMSMLVMNAAPAQAVDPGTVVAVIKAVKSAYDAYKQYTTHTMSLEQATAQIISAVNGAKQQILTEIDGIAAAQVRGCANAAVIDMADLPGMSPDTKQAFARDATACVTSAQAVITTLSDKAAIDQVGFAANIVGPIALVARAQSGLSSGIPALRSTLISLDQTVMTKLKPYCTATGLWGDVPADGRAHMTDVDLRCTAYNGDTGTGWTMMSLRRGQTVPTAGIDFSSEIQQAARNTSYVVAQAAIASL